MKQTALKNLRVEIDDDGINASCNFRFSDGLRSGIANMSLDKLNNTLPPKYRFSIERVHIFDDDDSPCWHIHATTDNTDWEHGDFRSDLVTGVTHDHNEDILRVEMRMFDFDAVMSEIKNRVVNEIAEEIAEQTRYDKELIGLHHTSLHFQNQDRDAGTAVKII